MSDPTLLKHFANLLISLSRDCVVMLEESKSLRQFADNEASPGRKSGLYCQSKIIRKNADMIKRRVIRNRVVLQQLFGTCNIITISKQTLR